MPVGETVNETLADAGLACRVIREAAELNREDPIREGALLRFGSGGQLVMTGDLHGHTANFAKLQKFCDLARSPSRYVILHELIHQEVTPPDGQDLSIDLLVQACQWKCDYPDNVFFMQSNHEMAQLCGQEITKGGRSVLVDFEQGIYARYGAETPNVLEAVNDYIDSLPLACQTASGVFCCHSLPDPATLATFDMSVFERELTRADMSPGGAAYSLVWGRFQTIREIDYFAEQLGVETLIVGHTPQEYGITRIGRLLIIASDHSHGVFLPFDLSKKWTAEALEEQARKFVSVA